MSDATEDLLRKLLLAWDGQWFLKVMARHGLDEAVELNRQVRRSFARIEMREHMKLAQLTAQPLTLAFEELRRFLRIGEVGQMQGTISARGEAAGTVEVTTCPAFEGVKRAGQPRQDWACVACSGNWQAWLGRLTGCSEEQLEVDIVRRLSAGDGACRIELRLVGDGELARGRPVSGAHGGCATGSEGRGE